MTHDLAEVKRNADIVAVIGRYVTLKKEGPEFIGCCPFHSEKTASFKVNPVKRLYKCFGCGAGGDVIDFIVAREDCSLHRAVEIIKNEASPISQSSQQPPREPEKTWTQVLPGEDAPAPDFKHYRHGRPSKVWQYNSVDGLPIGYTCRFDIADGKEVLPLSYATDGKVCRWRWMGFGKPRPLYGLDKLAAYPESTVILVEGEKTADAVQEHFSLDKNVVITWPGGSNGILHVDFTPLHGRRVVFWPDNDCQGLAAMLHVHHLIGDKIALSRFVPLDATLPKGWDGADRKWTRQEILDFIKGRIVNQIPANLDQTPDYLVDKYGAPVRAYRFNQIDSESQYIFGVFDKAGRWEFTKVLEPEQPEQPEMPPPPDLNHEPPRMPQPPPPSMPEDELQTAYDDAPFAILGFEKIDVGKLSYCFFDKTKKVLIKKNLRINL